MPQDLKAKALTELRDVQKRYLTDLNALSEEAITKSPGGAARTPANFTYEITVVNKRLMTRMQGGDPGPFDPNAWTETPAEFNTKDGAVKAFTESLNGIIAVVEATDEADMLKEITTPSGATSPFDLAEFCAYHINYHDGQLNYIQALNGDANIHWMD